MPSKKNNQTVTYEFLAVKRADQASWLAEVLMSTASHDERPELVLSSDELGESYTNTRTPNT